MKRFVMILSILAFGSMYSQVVIGGKLSVTNGSVSLEFNDDDTDIENNARGLILPWVTSTSAVKSSATTLGRELVPGTLIFDTSDRKVKMLKKNDHWLDLTADDDNVVDTALQDGVEEIHSSKVAIGSSVSNVDGVLVLEDSNKAMILPMVKSYTYIVSPEPGMMVYDLTNDLLCFFNGKHWTFWKAD